MMWFIISVVVGANAFGGQPHEFSSSRHFETQEACEAAMEDDAEELIAELKANDIEGPFRIKSHCEQDQPGDPV